MAEILCVTSGLSGMLFSSLELVRRLERAGHRVTYASFPQVEETVRDHGLPFLPLPPSRYDAFREEDSGRGLLARLRDLPTRRRLAVESLAVAGFADTIRQLDPDLLLIDGEMHEHILAASTTGVPTALLNSFVSIWRRPGLPPPHHPVRPGSGLWGTELGMRLLWLGLRLRKWGRASSQKVRSVGCDRLSVLRHLAEEVGFPFRREVDFGQWLIPFTYRHLPALTLHARELEFPHEPGAGVHYVGPMVLAERVDRRVQDRDRRRLERIFARRNSSSDRRLLIYAGFGSLFSTDEALLARLYECFAAHQEWDLVLSLAGRDGAAASQPLPENVHTFSWVPQIETLRHADVAVVHGGANTADECVLAGVPMLVYCGGETDMAGVGARIQFHGLGVVGDRRRDDAAKIGERIDLLLTEPGIRGRVDRLRRCYLGYLESRVAERTVESLLTARPAAIVPGAAARGNGRL